MPSMNTFLDDVLELLRERGDFTLYGGRHHDQGMPGQTSSRTNAPTSGSSDRLRKALPGRLASPTHSPTSSMRMAARMGSPSVIMSNSPQEQSNQNQRPLLPCGRFAHTDAEANLLASSFKMLILCLQRGESIPVPSPLKAAQFLAELAERPGNLPMQRRIVVGTPEVVKEGIEAIAAEYEADEILIVNIVYDQFARKRSYQLIADAFGLVGR
jgi:hypothetical protein